MARMNPTTDLLSVEDYLAGENDGTLRHDVIGHAWRSTGRRGDDEVIVWNGCNTTVRSNEVFASPEVAELFVAFYRVGDVSEPYVRRPLDL